MEDCALRTYKIKPGRMPEWLEWWRNNIVPYREAHGFAVTGSWVNEEANEFVWVVQSCDPAKSIRELTDAYNAAKKVDPDLPTAGDHLVLSTSYVFVRSVDV